MIKKIAIIQSNYIPWKGYFNIIKCVDAFVLLDNVQYTRRDWRNRNLIKTAQGLKWLTIPVKVKGQFDTKICEVETDGNAWRKSHWQQLSVAYKNATGFKLYKDVFEEFYLTGNETNLSIINFQLLTIINKILGITTPIRWAMDFDVPEEKTTRLLEICNKLEASEYISGVAAKNYLDVERFAKNNIKVRWANYDGYLEYNQLYPPFEHGVSIVDLLFNEGENAVNFLKPGI